MRARLESHLGSRQVARVIYGATIGLALIVALQGYPRSAGQMIGWLLGTAVAVALAEFYSEVVGAETSERHRVTRPSCGTCSTPPPRSPSASPSLRCSSCLRPWGR